MVPYVFIAEFYFKYFKYEPSQLEKWDAYNIDALRWSYGILGELFIFFFILILIHSFVSISSDAMNLCLSLITHGHEETAFSVLKSFTGLLVESQTSDSPDLGNFFLRHCVNMDKVRGPKINIFMSEVLPNCMLNFC